MKLVPISITGLLSVLLLGCRAPAGTSPHEMGVGEHTAAAEQEERLADEHASQFAADASVAAESCFSGDICWTSTVNPTEKHLAEAREHRKLAERHRAAAQTLREAESHRCAGISEQDRNMSPFAHREDVSGVWPLREDVGTGEPMDTRTVGATVVFAPVPGMTVERLRQLVRCHLARAAAIGHEMAARDMPYCPLALRHVEATVRSNGPALAVDVRSMDGATAAEILRRAQALKESAQGGDG